MTKLCDYGCGREATHPFKNGKWCCEDHFRKCPAERKRKSKIMKELWKNGIRDPNEQSKFMKQLWKIDDYKKRNSENIKKAMSTSEYRKRASKVQKRTIEKIKKYHSFFCQIEEIKEGPKFGTFFVHCHNHNCLKSKEKNGWFVPTGREIELRMICLEHPGGNDAGYFYCSPECKQKCPSFNLHSDPCKNKEKPYTDTEYQVWRKEVLKRDNYKCVGYDGHYCDKPAEHAHHIHPVKTHPGLALDPDNGISLCVECHKYIHRAGIECSYGRIAAKIC